MMDKNYKITGIGIVGVLLVLSVLAAAAPVTEARKANGVVPQAAGLQMLQERNITYRENLQRVAFISGLLKEENGGRESITKELLIMDRGFIKKFAEKAMKSSSNQARERAGQQMASYLLAKRYRKMITVSIKESSIKDLFEKKITAQEFINEIRQGRQSSGWP